MPTFTSQDAEINYQTFGDATKPALVFSNSLGTNFKMWQPQIDHFQQDFLSFAMTPVVTAHLLLHKVHIRLTSSAKTW